MLRGLKGDSSKDGEGFFNRGCSDRTRGKNIKVKERFKSVIRKKFLPVMMVRHWQKLSVSFSKVWLSHSWKYSRSG